MKRMTLLTGVVAATLVAGVSMTGSSTAATSLNTSEAVRSSFVSADPGIGLENRFEDQSRASRSTSRRPLPVATPVAKLKPKPKPPVVHHAVVPLASAMPKNAVQRLAMSMLAAYGWTSQFSCLNFVYTHESGWSATADNPHSAAYGIPQADPGSKMASAGADWRTNPATQITWGLRYIKSAYGSPCQAQRFWVTHLWY